MSLLAAFRFRNNKKHPIVPINLMNKTTNFTLPDDEVF